MIAIKRICAFLGGVCCSLVLTIPAVILINLIYILVVLAIINIAGVDIQFDLRRHDQAVSIVCFIALSVGFALAFWRLTSSRLARST